MYYVKPINNTLDSNGYKTMAKIGSDWMGVREKEHILYIDSSISLEVNGMIPTNSISAYLWTPLIEVENIHVVKVSEEKLEKTRRYIFQASAAINLAETSYYKVPMGTESAFDVAVYYSANSNVLRETDVKFDSNLDYVSYCQNLQYQARHKYYHYNNTINLTQDTDCVDYYLDNMVQPSTKTTPVIIQKNRYDPKRHSFDTLFQFNTPYNPAEQAQIIDSDMVLEYSLKGSKEIKTIKLHPYIDVIHYSDHATIKMMFKEWVTYDKKSKQLVAAVSKHNGIFVDTDCDMRIILTAKVKFSDTTRFVDYSYNFRSSEYSANEILDRVKIKNNSEKEMKGVFYEIKSSEII